MRQVLSELRAFEDGKAALRAKIDAEKKAAREKYTAEQRAEMRRKELPDGFDIAYEDKHDFLLSRAYTMAASGLSPTLIEAALYEQAVDFIHGGREWVKTEKAQTWIRDLAKDIEHLRGDASWFYLKSERAVDREPLSIEPWSQSPRHDLMVEIMQSLPDKLPITEAYDRLECDLKEFGMEFDRTSNNDQATVRLARSKCGFTVQRPYWVRTKSPDVSNLEPTSGELFNSSATKRTGEGWQRSRKTPQPL
jgi:hypothetical protein